MSNRWEGRLQCAAACLLIWRKASLPLAALLMAENLVRRWVLPQGKRAGVLATMRVYFATPP